MNIRNRNEFPLLLDSLKLKGYGIEIGVSEGKYSVILMTNKSLNKLYFLDPWKEYSKEVYNDSTNCSQSIYDQRYKMVVEKLAQYGERAVILRKDSVEALTDFSNEYFDFIYIDANHSYESVKKDIANWYPKLNRGGVFAGHDYFDRPPAYGVKSAVDEFCKTINVMPIVVSGTRRCPPSWYWIKGEEYDSARSC